MIYVFGEFELDTSLFELRKSGRPCKIEPQVFNVLSYLLHHRDRVVTKEELLDQVWPDRSVSEASLSQRLMAARKAVGDSGRTQRVIQTLHGRGYRFIAPIEERAVSSGDSKDEPTSYFPDVADSLKKTSIPLSELDVLPAIGRNLELDHLSRCLKMALAGSRQVVFVTGEAGLGKTTLVNSFIHEAKKEEAFWIGCGQCLEYRGTGEAYMPVLEAMGRLCREPQGESLIKLLARQAPTWLVQMPWLVNEEDFGALQKRVLGSTRDRMLREMLEAVEKMTIERPLLMILEDLHWSDPSTLDLISTLARRQEPARLLLIGTYRPGQVRQEAHPLLGIQQELRIRGQCVELALSYLTQEAVTEYLLARFPGVKFDSEISQFLRQRTNGNPLFMNKVVDDWVSRGALAEVNGNWIFQTSLQELAIEVPDSLKQLIEQQLSVLSLEDQDTLSAASAAGMEFSAAAVAASINASEEDVETRLAAMARQNQFIESRGVAEWPDGTIASCYGFIHDLYSEVLYERVPAGQKVRFHQRIGNRLEAGYSSNAEEHAVELAIQFDRGRDGQRAVMYLKLAAEEALQINAHQEAVRFLTRGLEILQGFPDGPERQEREFDFQATLGPAFIATKGWAAPEVEEAYLQARDLGQHLEKTNQLSSILYRLATVYEYRGEFHKSQVLLKERLNLPDQVDNKELLLESQELFACSTFHQGRFHLSLDYADMGFALYDSHQHRAMTSLYGKNHGVACQLWAGMSLWFLGYPEQALQRTRKAMALAKELGHLYSLASAQAQNAYLHQFRREENQSQEFAEATISIATEHGFPYRIATGKILKGWALSAQRQTEEGIALLRQGIAGYKATGAVMDLPYFLALLAEALGNNNQEEKGLEALDEAFEIVLGSRTFFFEAELYRLRGTLLSEKSKKKNDDDAEDNFLHALEIARRQEAKMLELRTAVSIGRLWRIQNKVEEALDLLDGIYSWFTEGFRTMDLLDAKSFVEDLK